MHAGDAVAELAGLLHDADIADEEDTWRTIFADIRDEQVLALEQAAIRIPSTTFEEGALADYLAGYMTDIGLDVEMMEVTHPGKPGTTTRQPIGRLAGTGGGPSLMLNGHMDPGVEMSGWSVDPYGARFEDGWVWGMGAHDAREVGIDIQLREQPRVQMYQAWRKGEHNIGELNNHSFSLAYEGPRPAASAREAKLDLTIRERFAHELEATSWTACLSPWSPPAVGGALSGTARATATGPRRWT